LLHGEALQLPFPVSANSPFNGNRTNLPNAKHIPRDSHTLLERGLWGAAGLGFEPRLTDPELDVAHASSAAFSSNCRQESQKKNLSLLISSKVGPASHGNKEPTSGLKPLTCSLRALLVRLHLFTEIHKRLKYGDTLNKGDLNYSPIADVCSC